MLLIPTDDPDVNVFLIDCEETIKKTETGREAIEDTVTTIFHVNFFFETPLLTTPFQNLEKDQRPVEYDIWIPAFQCAAYNQDLPEVTTCFKPEYKVATVIHQTIGLFSCNFS